MSISYNQTWFRVLLFYKKSLCRHYLLQNGYIPSSASFVLANIASFFSEVWVDLLSEKRIKFVSLSPDNKQAQDSLTLAHGSYYILLIVQLNQQHSRLLSIDEGDRCTYILSCAKLGWKSKNKCTYFNLKYKGLFFIRIFFMYIEAKISQNLSFLNAKTTSIRVYRLEKGWLISIFDLLYSPIFLPLESGSNDTNMLKFWFLDGSVYWVVWMSWKQKAEVVLNLRPIIENSKLQPKYTDAWFL